METIRFFLWFISLCVKYFVKNQGTNLKHQGRNILHLLQGLLFALGRANIFCPISIQVETQEQL